MKLLSNIKLLIAADGGASSGKTTASKLIAKKYGLPVIEGSESGVSDPMQAKEISKIRIILDGILATHCGQEPKKVRQDTERDNYMTGEEALKYGLIDKLINKREDVVEKKKE